MVKFFDALEARKNKSLALAHKIALYISSYRKPALIVEGGEDLFFYSALSLRQFSHIGIQFFVGNGRPGVLETISSLEKMGKKGLYYGIIDRDFEFEIDRVIMDGRVFVTKYYSFENYFGEKESLISIGKSFFALEHGQEIDRWTAYIENMILTIQEALFEIHVYALCCHATRKKCLMANISALDLVEIDADGSLKTVKCALEIFIENSNMNIEDLPAEIIGQCTEKLREMDWKIFIRGHYFFEIFVKMINQFRLKLDAERRTHGQSRARTKAELSLRHTLEAATSCIPTPDFVSDCLTAIAGAADAPA